MAPRSPSTPAPNHEKIGSLQYAILTGIPRRKFGSPLTPLTPAASSDILQRVGASAHLVAEIRYGLNCKCLKCLEVSEVS